METTPHRFYNAPMKSSLARTIALWMLAAMIASGPIAALAQTGLPLPRFASLRANEVHLRTGPGKRYPVDWVFIYPNMPVEIVAEFDNWRKVRDWQGTEGWVHRAMLSGRRTGLVRGGVQPMRRAPEDSAPLVARVEERVIGRMLECAGAWCRIQIQGQEGWMRRSHIWGIYKAESLN